MFHRVSILFAQPGSGCWHSSPTVLQMTGSTNSAGATHSAAAPQLCDPVGVESDLTPEARSAPEPQPDRDAWRQEVAARLARYRTRRKPRTPRYPSLLLPFDSWPRSYAAATTALPASLETAGGNLPREDGGVVPSTLFRDHDECRSEDRSTNPFEYQAQPEAAPAPEVSAKIIEFPRSAAIPVVESSLLADPIFDHPRIVEAPEIVPPAPALGGILIEPAPEQLGPFAPTASLIPSASIAHRLCATGIDALILIAALSAFGAIFVRFNPVRGPLPLLAGIAGALAVLLWMTYEFLFMVCVGSTLGLRAAGLKLTSFDGSPVPRRTRRWRVLASFLSGFSAGLGYLWCFLDQDSLCWHDRITRTHIQSARSAP